MSANKKAVAARLAKIAQANGGRLTTAAVIADAKSKTSPLHKYFDWDIKTAATKWWKCQAQALIASVQIEVTTSHRILSAPAYIKDPSTKGDEPGYIGVAELRDDRSYARDALLRELKQANALFDRAVVLAEVLGLSKEFDEFQRKLTAINLKLAKAA